MNNKIIRFQEEIEEISQEEVYERPVSELKCLKGIDTYPSMSKHVKVSNFTRLQTAKVFVSYLRLTTWKSSSRNSINYTNIPKQEEEFNIQKDIGRMHTGTG